MEANGRPATRVTRSPDGAVTVNLGCPPPMTGKRVMRAWSHLTGSPRCGAPDEQATYSPFFGEAERSRLLATHGDDALAWVLLDPMRAGRTRRVAIGELWNSRSDATRRGEAPRPLNVPPTISRWSKSNSPFTRRARLEQRSKSFGAPRNGSAKRPHARGSGTRLKRIKPVFGDCDPHTVKLAAISAWRKVIEETVRS